MGMANYEGTIRICLGDIDRYPSLGFRKGIRYIFQNLHFGKFEKRQSNDLGFLCDLFMILIRIRSVSGQT